MSERGNVGSINVGLGLDISNLDRAVAEAGRVFQSLQQSLNRVSLQGAIKGDPFAGQAKYLDAFGKTLDSALDRLSQTDGLVARLSKNTPAGGTLNWFKNLESQVERVSRAMEAMHEAAEAAAQPPKTTVKIPSNYQYGYKVASDLQATLPLPAEATSAVFASNPTRFKAQQNDLENALKNVQKGYKELAEMEDIASKKQVDNSAKQKTALDAIEKELSLITKLATTLGPAGVDVSKYGAQLANMIPTETITEENVDIIKAVEAAIEEVSKAYAEYDRAVALAAKQTVQLTDAQKRSISTQEQLAQVNRNQKYAAETQAALAALRNEEASLSNIKRLRDAIATQVGAGQEVDEEAVTALKQQTGQLQNYKNAFLDLQQKMDALKGAGAADNTTLTAYDKQMQTLLTGLPHTARLVESLQGDFKAAFMEANGYGKSIQTLRAELKAAGDQVIYLSSLSKQGVFDTAGAEKLKTELEAARLQYKQLNAEIRARNTGTAAAQDELALQQRKLNYEAQNKSQIESLQAVQRQLVMDIKNENDVLASQQKLRETITQLAKLGVAPEKDIIAALGAQSALLSELQKKSESLHMSFRSKMKVGDYTGAFKDLQEEKKTLAEVNTVDALTSLSPDQQRMWASMQGYGKSVAELRLEFNQLSNTIKMFESLDVNRTFGKNTDEAKRFTAALREMRIVQQDTKNELDLKDRRGGASAAIENAAYDRQARAYLDQASSIDTLQNEYKTLLAVQERVVALTESGAAVSDVTTQKERALGAVMRDRIAIVERLAAAGMKLDEEQNRLYHTEVLGLQTSESVAAKLEKVRQARENLQNTGLDASWHNATENTALYNKQLDDLTITMRKLELTQAQIAHGVDSVEAMTARENLSTATRQQTRNQAEAQLNREYRDRINLLSELRAVDSGKVTMFNTEPKVLANNTAFNKELREYIELVTRARAAGVKLTEQQEQEANSYEKLAKKVEDVKHREAGIMALDTKRAMWFLQLRMVWGAYNLISQSVQEVIQFEQQLMIAASTANATIGEYTQIKEAILDVARATTYSAAEISEAMVTIVQAGFSASESIQVLKNTAELASATMANLTTTAELVTTALRAWQIPAARSGEVADAFAAAVNNSKLSMDALATSFNYVTGITPDLNVSLQETLALLSTLGNMGISPSTAGTSVRALMSSLVQPTDKFTESLRNVGLTIKDVNPEFHTIGDILKTLNKAGFDTTSAFQGLERRAASGIAILVKTADGFDDMTEAMYESGAAARMADRNMETIQAQYNQMKDALKEFLITAGTPLSPMIQDLEKLTTVLINAATEGIKPFSIALTGLYEAVRLSATGWKWLIQGVTSSRTAFDVAKQSSAVLIDQLVAQKHALQDTQLQLATTQDSYSRFTKTMTKMAYSADFGDKLSEELAGARGKITALERAGADKRLTSGQSEQLVVYKQIMEELLKQEASLGRAGVSQEKLNKLTADLKTMTSEVDKGYQAQIASLQTLAGLQTWTSQQTAMRAYIGDANQIVHAFGTLKDYYRDYDTMSPLKRLFSGLSDKETDEVLKKIEAIQTAANNMNPEQAEVFYAKMAEGAGKTTQEFKAYMNAFTMAANAQKTSFQEVEQQSLSSNNAFVRMMGSWSGAIRELSVNHVKFDYDKLFSEDDVTKAVAKQDAAIIAAWDKDAVTLTNALVYLHGQIHSNVGKNIAESQREAALVKEIVDRFSKAASDDSNRRLTPHLTNLLVSSFQKISSDGSVSSAIRELSENLGSLVGTSLSSSVMNGIAGIGQSIVQQLRTDLQQGQTELVTAGKNLANAMTTAALTGNDSFVGVAARRQGEVQRKQNALSAEVYNNFINAKTETDKAQNAEIYTEYAVNTIENFKNIGAAAKAVVTDMGDLKSASISLSHVMLEQFDLTVPSYKVKDFIHQLKSGTTEARTIGVTLGLAGDKLNRFTAMMKGFEQKPPGRTKSTPVYEVEALAEQLKLLKAQTNEIKASRLENLRSVDALRGSIAAKKALLEADLTYVQAQQKKAQEAERRRQAAEGLVRFNESGGNQEKAGVARTGSAKALKDKVAAQKQINDTLQKTAKTADEIAALEVKIGEIKWEDKHIQSLFDLNRLQEKTIALQNEETRLSAYQGAHIVQDYATRRTLYKMEMDLMVKKLALAREQAAQDAKSGQEAIETMLNTATQAARAKVAADTGNPTEMKAYRAQKAMLEDARIRKAILEQTLPVLEAEVALYQKQSDKGDLAAAAKLATLRALVLDLEKQITENKSKQANDTKTIIDLENNAKAIKHAEDRKTLWDTGSFDKSIDNMGKYLKDELGKQWADLMENQIGDSLDELAGKVKDIYGGLSGALAKPLSDKMYSAITGDNEELDALKDKYNELAEARDEAFKKAQQSGDYSEYQKLNQQMVENMRLQEKQKDLWGQMKKAFADYVKAAIKGILEICAKLMMEFLLRLAIKSLFTSTGSSIPGVTAATGGVLSGGTTGSVEAHGRGGVMNGGAQFPHFATGGVTDNTMFALLGDNPSKKEIVIPSQNIAKNQVSGYAREQGSGDGTGSGITIANLITQEDIYNVMAQDGGRQLIINAVGKDLMSKGSTYRIVKGIK